jgi:hypothetical protein
MPDWDSLSNSAAEFRRHYDQFYLGVIPRLLNEEGMFLAFVSTLAAIESLAGTYAPNRGSGERFREFIKRYFPSIYEPHSSALWKFRNRMIHSFNPRPFAIVCHNSRMHLVEAGDTRILNAEDFYADTVAGSRAYFTDLYSSTELQLNFEARLNQDDGGVPRATQIIESVAPNVPAA